MLDICGKTVYVPSTFRKLNGKVEVNDNVVNIVILYYIIDSVCFVLYWALIRMHQSTIKSITSSRNTKLLYKLWIKWGYNTHCSLVIKCNFFHFRFKTIIPIPEQSMIQMLCYLLEVLLTPENTPPDCHKDLYELYFVFACIWAFGGALFQDQVNISHAISQCVESI